MAKRVRWRAYKGKWRHMPAEMYQRRILKLFRIGQDVAADTGLAICREHDGIAFFEKTDDSFGYAFSILVNRDGDLVPDGFPADDGDEEYCGPAEWKAKAAAALLARLDLSEETKHDMEFARKVFAGEILHPSIVASIR